MHNLGDTSMKSDQANGVGSVTAEVTTEVIAANGAQNTAHNIETHAPQRKVSRSAIAVLAAASVVLAVVVVVGLHSRVAAETRLQAITVQASVPSVNVTHPHVGQRAQELVLPGNTQAFIDSPIYARTNGYLKRWYVDIGARVSKGQLLAEIETPELDLQLRQASAELATAQANLNLSRITSERDQNLLKTHSVSTQERDNAVNAYAANQATFSQTRRMSRGSNSCKLSRKCMRHSTGSSPPAARTWAL